MDTKRIGAFIAQCRKEKNMTQVQLAEELGITNQAVSKWETGKGMPDVALMQQLCDVLEISINELFSGEHLSDEEYKGKAEENFSRLLKEKQCENLQPVKYLYSVCSKVFLIVAVIELAIGIVGNFLNPETEILEAMLINASVWLALYAVAIGKVLYDKNRLKKIKQSGVCVDAEIKDMLPAVWIRRIQTTAP